MITLGYFYPLVFAMGCGLKKYRIPFTQKREKMGKSAFFKDTSNYFSLLNLKSLIERIGLLRNLWEGEREKFVKYVKAEMNTICDTETYMPCVLNSLLRTHCLNNFMKDNQHYQEPKMSKMRDFKLYKSLDALHEDFSTGKMLLGVIVKLPDYDENIYVCYTERKNSQFMFEREKINYAKGCSRFNLYYAPFLFSKKNSEVFIMKSRDEIRKRISGFVIIHPMVTTDQIYKKANGHMVLTHCWRIRTSNILCGFVPQSSDLCVFVED